MCHAQHSVRSWQQGHKSAAGNVLEPSKAQLAGNSSADTQWPSTARNLQEKPLRWSIWTHKSTIHPATGESEQLQVGCHMLWTEACLALCQIACSGWHCLMQGFRD